MASTEYLQNAEPGSGRSFAQFCAVLRVEEDTPASRFIAHTGALSPQQRQELVDIMLDLAPSRTLPVTGFRLEGEVLNPKTHHDPLLGYTGDYEGRLYTHLPRTTASL